jgi:hypothetical protein
LLPLGPPPHRRVREARPDRLSDLPAWLPRGAKAARALVERCSGREIPADADRAVAWCHLNAEGDLLADLIPGAVQVAGSDSPDEKEAKLAAFTRGETRVLVTKPKIGAWGLNWQHCHRITYFPSHSYEQWYQAIRRCWRFGQTMPVIVDVVATEGSKGTLANLERKAAQADRMFAELVRHMRDTATPDIDPYDQQIRVPRGRTDQDLMTAGRLLRRLLDVLPELPASSIHLSVYSPPFAGLYHYSSSDRDLSNAPSYEAFLAHYRRIVEAIHRVTMPGRITAVHCRDVPTGNTGRGDALTDFPGDIIRLHQDCGFAYVARYHVWKEPLGVRNRTMMKALAHTTIVEDSTRCSAAAADYLLCFRRHGDNPVPVTHPAGLLEYAGARPIPEDLLTYRGHNGNQIENRYSHWIWRQYALRVLGRRPHSIGAPFVRRGPRRTNRPPVAARRDRTLSLWSNEGERVLTHSWASDRRFTRLSALAVTESASS